MGADSVARRVVKKLIYPWMSEDQYGYFVALSKAWDIRMGADSEPELDLVSLAAHPGDTVLDLGANFGYYSYPLSRAVGPTGRVYAFEPVPFTHRTLRHVARLLRLRNVEIVPMGCGERAGSVTFEIPIQANGALSAGLAYIGGRRQDHAGKETQVRWNSTRTVAAELVRLDDFLPALHDLPFIKADVEGSELFAFRGAERTMTKHLPTVLCEINPWYLQGFGLEVNDLTSFFFDRGYRLYRYDDKRLAAVAPTEIVERNYVFVHPSRAHRLRSVIRE
jgi:FkbM family methyltransferase